MLFKILFNSLRFVFIVLNNNTRWHCSTQQWTER